MRKSDESNGGDSNSIIDYYIEVLHENERFLRDNAEDTYREVVGLINDTIDYVSFTLEEKKEKAVIDPFRFFLYHVLMPQSYAVLADLLMGNLPACFMVLRLMLETMAESYLASLHSDSEVFFEGKTELLFGEKSKSKIIKEFGEEISFEDKPVALWGKLSNEWIHTEGVVTRIIQKIVQEGDIPAWALVIPINYTKEDLDTLNELSAAVKKFREVLKRTMEKYSFSSDQM